MPEEFNVGEVVRLKSGGPKMTIEVIQDFSFGGKSKTKQAKCVWFDEKKIHCEKVFEFATLERVKERPSTAITE